MKKKWLLITRKLVSCLSPFRSYFLGFITPLEGYKSSINDARRFSLLIGIILATAGYLFFEEANRRSRLADIIFYDEVLHAIESFTSSTNLPEGFDENINFASIADSTVLNSLENVKEVKQIDSITTVTSTIRSCEVTYYKLDIDKMVIGTSTDRMEIALELSGNYLLLEFPFLCNIFNSGETIYALVGKYENKLGGKGELGAIYDKPGVHLGVNAAPFYRSDTDVKKQLLRIAQNTTGKYYKPAKYQDAISDLATTVQKPPAIFGVSFPTRMTVLILPIALFIVSFSFFHRVRRIHDSHESVWVLMHADGLLEKTFSVLWKIALVATPLVVYLTASLYLSPGAELRGDIDYLFAQRYSSDQVNVLNPGLWLAGAKNIYVLSLSVLSLAIIVLGLFVLSRTKNKKA